MKYFWITLCLMAAIGIGYYYYGMSFTIAPAVSLEVHETKAIITAKTRDHEALWIDYKYTDLTGHPHTMMEKIPYVDLWEELSVGQEVDILYRDDGVSELKVIAFKLTHPSGHNN
jgi:hypothetical protein